MNHTKELNGGVQLSEDLKTNMVWSEQATKEATLATNHYSVALIPNSPTHFGPFQIMAHIGQEANKLKLPDLTQVQSVFHA